MKIMDIIWEIIHDFLFDSEDEFRDLTRRSILFDNDDL